MKIRRISDGKIFEVRKYVDGFGEESVWCDDWYGHHMIGRDCEFVDTYTSEETEAFAEWCSEDGKIHYDTLTKKWCRGAFFIGKTTTQLREQWENGRMAK